MYGSRKPFLFTLLAVLALSAAGFGSASDIYLAQSAAGAGNGADCADAKAVSFFNSSSNWGSGSTQIGPGTTAHLCGTITGASGGTVLSFQGSGASGSPVTLRFESGAIVQAPYFSGNGGGINADGRSWIVIDGGGNGVLQNTANGTNLANKQNSRGIEMNDCSNCEVKGLTISNIYVHANNLSDEAGQDTYGIYQVGGSNVIYDHNTVHDAKWCLQYSPAGGTTQSNVEMGFNTTYNCDHGFVIAGGNSGSVLNGWTIHDSIMHDGANWDDSNNDNHHDGMHIFSVCSGCVLTGGSLYNNYVYGNWGANLNDPIFVEANTGGTDDGWQAFNNVLTITSNHVGVGFLCCDGDNVQVYNNTIVGPNTSIGPAIHLTGSNVTVQNNIVSTVSGATQLDGGGSIATWNNNLYYNIGNSGFSYHGNISDTMAQWSSASGADKSSLTSNPQLTSDFRLQSGSPAIQAGANLSSVVLNLVSSLLSTQPLQKDAAGNARPGGATKWDLGAYQFGSAAPSQPAPPAPPTGLSVTVQ